ncbi:MAG: hypothetical protein M3169_01835 [Candidatus Eremiobacteraeota bacterium]|nr:hypothetical protein [Candidatus Eremiobacteraeota bacterium]
MISRKRVYSALFSAGAACAILASGLAGCSGGGGTTAVTPITPAQTAPGPAAQGDERVVQTVDASAASGSFSVSHEAAHAAPMQGQPVKQMATGQRAIRTGGAYDLAYYGGPYLTSASSINLYVNCAGTCWGSPSPGTFMQRIAGSSFVHIIDQYIGSSANNRYPYASGWQVNYNTSGTLQDQDIYNIVHSVAVSQGTGYGKLYHVFLQSGVSQCSSSAGGCYAQQYCAYHGSVDFGDIGHTLYSVEPYQGISGCNSPSNKLQDSTGSTLSHEWFEAITDPDVAVNNIAWYNNIGGEIGDICRNYYGNVSLSGFTYNIQKEYTNVHSACSFST